MTAAGHSSPPSDPADRGANATLGNWLRAPYNRAAFQRVCELVPSAMVDRGDREPWLLPGMEAGTNPQALRDLTFERADQEGEGAPETLRRLVTETHTDALLVLHRGRLVHEEYHHGMERRTSHLLMSISKSITATAVGAVVGLGSLRPDDLVTEVAPELSGTGMDGATVRHLLDMRTGTREDITTLEEQQAYYATVQWAPSAPTTDHGSDVDSRSHFRRFTLERPHGGDFEYRSTLTCVLAMLAERVTGRRTPALLSHHLWAGLGADRDAQITVDRSGHALADIGVSCTARDLARLGEVLRRDGSGPDGDRLVPAEWIDDTLRPDTDQVTAFAEHGSPYVARPSAYYRNQWWVVRPRTAGNDGIYMALGIHGQLLLIHEAAEVVIVKLSSWPEPWFDLAARRAIEGCIAVAEQVAGLDR